MSFQILLEEEALRLCGLLMVGMVDKPDTFAAVDEPSILLFISPGCVNDTVSRLTDMTHLTGTVPKNSHKDSVKELLQAVSKSQTEVRKLHGSRWESRSKHHFRL